MTTRQSKLTLIWVAWIFLLFSPFAYLLSHWINQPIAVHERDLMSVSARILQPPEIVSPKRGGDRSPYLRLSLQDFNSQRFIGDVRGWDFLPKETTQDQLLRMQENQPIVIFVAIENQHKDLYRVWKIQKNDQLILDLNATHRAEQLLAEYKQESANVVILFFAFLGLGLLTIAGLRQFRSMQSE